MKKIHDNHIDEQPEEPTTNIIDEQPEEPEQPTEEATSNIIDEHLVTKAKRKGKKIVKEPEQPKETVFKNSIIDNVKNLPLEVISNIIDYIPGVTTSTINGDRIGYYNIKINDICLQYYEKN